MKRVLVTGAAGLIGSRLLRDLPAFGWETSGTSRAGGKGLVPLRLESEGSLEAALDAAAPDAVVHAAAISSPDEAERDRDLTWKVNAEAVGALGRSCAARGLRLIFFSTDLVFPGDRAMSREDDPVAPVNFYGRAKVEAERLLREVCPDAVSLRVCAVYGCSLSRPCFFDTLACDLSAGRKARALCDQWRTATDCAQLPEVIDRLLRRPDVRGVQHWGGAERATRVEFARALCEVSGLDASLIVPSRTSELPYTAARPADVSLDSSRLAALLDLRPAALREGLSRAWAERGRGA